MRTKALVGLVVVLSFVVLFGVAGYAKGSYFGVPNKAIGYPEEFDQTEAAIAKAESSPGARYCPEKITKAKELAKEGVEIYWACRTKEAMKLLSDARALAAEAERCQAPPKAAPVAKPAPAPRDSDGDGVPDSKDQCPNTPKGATVDARGCWAYQGEVLFEFGKAEIKPQFYRMLDEGADILKKNPGIMVEIQGHTDNIGTKEVNQKLSEDRAKAVMGYLVGKGVAKDRLTAKGYNFSKPVASNSTEEGRKQNRRVEYRIMER
jgi:outer membrane protein OmpA-like peptidoglycan-associated protein